MEKYAVTRTVHLIRHGQSTFNAHMTATGEDPMTPDAPLSSVGEAQVADLRSRMADVAVDLLVTTPFTRAIQTGLGAFGGRGLPVVVEALHREHLGASCDVGRSPAILAESFPDLEFGHLDDPWWHHDPDHDGPFAIEPHPSLEDRVERFREWLSGRPERRIVVVGHGTFFWKLTGCFMNNAEVVTLEL